MNLPILAIFLAFFSSPLLIAGPENGLAELLMEQGTRTLSGEGEYREKIKFGLGSLEIRWLKSEYRKTKNTQGGDTIAQVRTGTLTFISGGVEKLLTDKLREFHPIVTQRPSNVAMFSVHADNKSGAETYVINGLGDFVVGFPYLTRGLLAGWVDGIAVNVFEADYPTSVFFYNSDLRRVAMAPAHQADDSWSFEDYFAYDLDEDVIKWGLGREIPGKLFLNTNIEKKIEQPADASYLVFESGVMVGEKGSLSPINPDSLLTTKAQRPSVCNAFDRKKSRKKTGKKN